MFQKPHIFTLFVGALAGVFLGGVFIIVSIPLLEFISSPAKILEIALIMIASIALGTTFAYTFIIKRSLHQQTAKLVSALEINKTKDEFLSKVLHQLRTPLTGMKWSLKGMLEEMGESDTYKSRMLQLYEANDHALGAVEGLMQASQASMGRIVYNFEFLGMQNLQQLIEKNVRRLDSMAQEKEISLHIEMPPASKNSVRVDQEKIATIVQTLIENAVMYTKKAGTIRVYGEEKQSAFFLHISDTGIGIPLKDQPKVFLQFFRSKNAIQMQPSGFGIGLFLVKTFLKHHHGEISFTTEEGKGSTFSFRLPIINNSTEKLLEKTLTQEHKA